MESNPAELIARSEVRRHSTRKSCWIIINNIVYDVTEFIDSHPGGAKTITQYGGCDATEAFELLHSASVLETYLKPSQVVGIADNDMSGAVPESRDAKPKRTKLSRILSIQDFEKAASDILPPRSFAFFKSGAEDEQSSNWNLNSWKTVQLRPRILRPISSIDLSCSLFGTRWSAPFLICPAGGGKLANPAGEVLLTKAAARHGILHWVCNNAGCSMKEIAEARSENQTLYWQIYAKSDLRLTEMEVKEAIRLGYKGFALTVDAVCAGIRERDLRVGLEEQSKHDASHEEEEEEDESEFLSTGQTVKRPPVWTEFDWISAVAWLRSSTDLPIAIKGIQCWEDAAMCLQYDGVHPWLSNHGGRQLDSAPSAIDVLVEMRKHCPEVFHKREVIVDGGVTRGADIVKALALGARAVGLGRPFLYALVYGEAGVGKAISILKHELETTMALTGVTSIDQLSPSYVNASGYRDSRL